jgi:hypothetical protein
MSSIFRSKQTTEINFPFKMFTKFYMFVPFLSQVHYITNITGTHFSYSIGSR